MSTTHLIRSTSPNQQKLAKPSRRFQAKCIDNFICLSLLASLVFISAQLHAQHLYTGILILALPLIYFLCADALPNGQSLGKRLMGLAVVSKHSGEPCNIIQSICRNMLSLHPSIYWLDSLFIFSKKRQRLGDLIANTLVVQQP